MATIDIPINKWAVQTGSNILQVVMLSRSEVIFFDSGVK